MRDHERRRHLARLPQLEQFAAEHGLKIGTIADLIRHRTEHESTIQRGRCRLPTDYGEFRVVAYHDDIGDTVHLALVRGEPRKDRPTLVPRITYRKACSICLPTCTAPATGRWRALARVAADGAGVVVILQQEEPPAALVRRIQHFQKTRPALELVSKQHGREEMRTYGSAARSSLTSASARCACSGTR